MIRKLYSFVLGFIIASIVSVPLAQIAPGVPPSSGGGGTGGTSMVRYSKPVSCNESVAAYSDGWESESDAQMATNCDTIFDMNNGYLTVVDTSDGANFRHHVLLPTTYDSSGSVSLRIFWGVPTTSTGDVLWDVSTVCASNGDVRNAAYNTKQTVTDTGSGVAEVMLIAPTLTPVTMTGCVAGDWLAINFFRNGAQAGDTLATTAYFIAIEITIPTT